MNIKGAVFDADGTLLDSLSIWDTIASDYLKDNGFVPEEGLDQKIAAWSIDETVTYFQTAYGLSKDSRTIRREIHERLYYFYQNGVKLKGGVKEVLQDLNDRRVKMIVATGSEESLIRSALENNGVMDLFKGIVSCDAYGPKTDGKIYTAALQLLGTDVHETAVFEDELGALKTAKNMDFVTIGVYDRHQKEQTKIKETSDLYLKDWRMPVFHM